MIILGFIFLLLFIGALASDAGALLLTVFCVGSFWMNLNFLINGEMLNLLLGIGIVMGAIYLYSKYESKEELN